MKTIKKKRWFSITDCENGRADADISWSDSDSEDYEDTQERPQKKRAKANNGILCREKSKTWISVIDESIVPSKTAERLNSSNELPQTDLITTALDVTKDFMESPIINGLRQSPTHTQTSEPVTQEESPIINHRDILKRIKCRYKPEDDKSLTQKIHDDSSTSPQLFQSQTSDLIDSQSSPLIRASPIEISFIKTQVSSPFNIDPFPSQNSSKVATSVYSSSDSRQSLYHQPPPKKRRFKKGGLAHQLHKALDLHNTSLAIWQHELHRGKTKGEKVEPYVSDGLEFEFCVINKWKEYGCTVLECKFRSRIDSDKVLSRSVDMKIQNHNTFIVVVAVNTATKVCFESNNYFKLFSPYSTKLINYQQQQTLCFINTSRFVPV